jgi:hypothetical protein
MKKNQTKTVWVLATHQHLYFEARKNLHNAFVTPSMLKAAHFESRHHAESALTLDMKFNGFVARKVEIWRAS